MLHRATYVYASDLFSGLSDRNLFFNVLDEEFPHGDIGITFVPFLTLAEELFQVFKPGSCDPLTIDEFLDANELYEPSEMFQEYEYALEESCPDFDPQKDWRSLRDAFYELMRKAKLNDVTLDTLYVDVEN